jgi:hypothetical protein
MSSALSKLLADISSQKSSYHAKLLSPIGEWSLFMRDFQLYDFTIDISNLLIPEFYFASMSVSLLFDFDLTNIEPLNLEFDWSFPTVDEWLNGINVVITPSINPAATDLETFVYNNIKPEYQELILSSMITKGYYGITNYGSSYYDPAAARELIRNTISLMFKNHPDFTQRKIALMTLTNALDANEDVVTMIHDRMSMVMSSHTECFILDYGMLNVSNLCQEAPDNPDYGVVPYIDINGDYREAKIMTLDDMQYGCVLDVSSVDYCYLMPEGSIYNTEVTAPSQTSGQPLQPTIWKGIDDKLSKFKGRYMITSAAFSNYNRGDESANHSISERTNTWGELQAGRYHIENMIDSTLSQLVSNLDPIKRRTYVSAVLQLVGYKGKRHRWGFGMFKTMNNNDLKNWWVQYWSSQGLDANILGQLFDRVAPFLDAYAKKKVELGASIRLKRLGIPLD